MGLFSRRVERSVPHAVGPQRSIGDPALAEYLGINGYNGAGVPVTESSALGLTSLWRGVSLTANTVAGLPLKTYTESDDGQRTEVKSVMDNPGGDWYTPFEFFQLVMTHLLLHGNAFLLHVYTEGGSLAALMPIHPSLVTVKWDPEAAVKLYSITIDGRTEEYTDDDVTHVMGLSTDGLVGVSPIRTLRNALGTSIAANDTAATMFSNGLSVAMLVTPDEDMDEEDAKVVVASLRAQMTGVKNTNGLAFMNYNLKAQQLALTAEDAQFVESRQMQVAEVARFVGCPVQLLMQDGASSWGSGIQELIIAWVKFTLRGWTGTIEQKLSRLLSNSRWVEFEYKALLQGTPQQEIELLIEQVQAGLITVDEARAVMNLPPMTPAQEAEGMPPEPAVQAPATTTPEEAPDGGSS